MLEKFEQFEIQNPNFIYGGNSEYYAAYPGDDGGAPPDNWF